MTFTDLKAPPPVLFSSVCACVENVRVHWIEAQSCGVKCLGDGISPAGTLTVRSSGAL